MDNFNQLRLKQMFGPGMPSESFMGLPQQNMGIPNIDDLYQPQMEMQNLFAESARNSPQRNQYQPDLMRKIGAALANLGSGGPAGMWGGNPVGYKSNISGGLAAQRSIQDEPYDRAVEDYKLKIDPLRAAADDERLANVNNRLVADNTVNRSIQERNVNRQITRDEELARQSGIKEEQADKRIKIAEARAQVYAARNNGMKFFIDEAGQVVGVSPDGKTLAKTGLMTGDLSEMDKISLQLENDLTKIGAQNEANIKLKETVPGKNTAAIDRSPTARTNTPGMDRTAKINRIQQAIVNKPELAPYFELGTNKLPTGNIKQGKIFRHDENLYKEAQAIAGGSVNELSTTSDQMIRVRNKKTGQTGQMPASKFNPDLFEKVQ